MRRVIVAGIDLLPARLHLSKDSGEMPLVLGKSLQNRTAARAKNTPNQAFFIF
jgi:hypothetical protein